MPGARIAYRHIFGIHSISFVVLQIEGFVRTGTTVVPLEYHGRAYFLFREYLDIIVYW